MDSYVKVRTSLFVILLSRLFIVIIRGHGQEIQMGVGVMSQRRYIQNGIGKNVDEEEINIYMSKMFEEQKKK